MPEYRTEAVVYAGRRRTTKGKLAYFYADLVSGADRFGTSKPLYPGCKVGEMLALTFDGDSFFIGGAHAPAPKGQIEDTDQILRWQLEERADVALQTRVRETERIVKEGNDVLREQLGPVRDALAGMQIDRRSITVHWIMDYLLTGTVRVR